MNNIFQFHARNFQTNFEAMSRYHLLRREKSNGIPGGQVLESLEHSKLVSNYVTLDDVFGTNTTNYTDIFSVKTENHEEAFWNTSSLSEKLSYGSKSQSQMSLQSHDLK